MAKKWKIHIMVASTVYHNRDLLLQICGTDRAPNPKFVKECLTEHIFPKKWQTTNYNGWDEKDAQAYLDCFGNKIVFEKKLNILNLILLKKMEVLWLLF